MKTIPEKVSLPFLIALFLLAGCKGDLTKHGEVFSELMKSEKGIFREVNIGDSRQEVEEAEESLPSEQNEQVLSYEGRLGESGGYIIRYEFEEGRLYAIIAEVDFEKREEGQKMIQGFKEYFSARYGAFVEDKGKLVWIPKGTNNQKEVAIEMTNESDFGESLHWTLNIYKNNYSGAAEAAPPSL